MIKFLQLKHSLKGNRNKVGPDKVTSKDISRYFYKPDVGADINISPIMTHWECLQNCLPTDQLDSLGPQRGLPLELP